MASGWTSETWAATAAVFAPACCPILIPNTLSLPGIRNQPGRDNRRQRAQGLPADVTKTGRGAMAAESGPGQGKSQRADVSYPLITNGLDYLLDVVDRLATDPGEVPDARALKYAVLHLQAAAEVLLKARLQREHWTLVFKNPAAATHKDFKSVTFDSCTTGEAFDRLNRIVGLDLPKKAGDALTKLARDRNALQHYGLTTPAGAVEARAVEVLNFLLPFISDHLLPGFDAKQRSEAALPLAMVRSRLRHIEAYLTKRMNELRTELKDVQDRTVTCPDCEHRALVLGGKLSSCRFCLNLWDPEEAAADYAWQMHGMDPLLPGYGDEAAVCPECESHAVVAAVTAAAPDRPSILCFACATDFTGTFFVLCEGGCSRAVPTDSGDPVCPDCTGPVPGRF
jgi:DNA-directed RNA polymerase subunit RPC12/RpoP